MGTIDGFNSASLFYLIAHKEHLYLDPLSIGTLGTTLASLSFLVLLIPALHSCSFTCVFYRGIFALYNAEAASDNEAAGRTA